MQPVRQPEPAASPVPASGLSLSYKLLYGAGEITNSIKVSTFGLYSMFFATTVMSLPGIWVGIIGAITVLWDATIDPFIGFLTDGTKGRGRRYGFMLIGAIGMGLGYGAFFNAPKLAVVPLFGWLLATSLVMRTANSMYVVPYYAIGANLSDDYHERTSITAVRGIMSTIGTAMAAALSFLVFFPEKTPGVDPKLNPAGYSSMGFGLGAVMTLVAFAGIVGVLRLRSHTGAATAPAAEHARRPRFLKSMKESMRNSAFRTLLGASACIVIGMTLNTALMLYYATYYVEIKNSGALSSAQAILYSSAILGTIFWLRASKKMNKHSIVIVSCAVTSVLLLGGWLLFGKGHLFGTGDARPLLAGYGITGFFSCILAFVPASMLADVIDENELAVGHRREGALFGMFSLGQQAAIGFGVLLAGIVLDRFVGLVPGKAEQSALTISRIGIAYSVFPAVLLGIASMLLMRYKLSRSRVESIQAELRERRAQMAA